MNGFSAGLFAALFYLCNMNGEMGKWIIVAGICIVIAGIVIYFFHDRLHWLGRLPGDIRIERPNFKMYFPLATMILLSIIFSLVIWLVRKF
jgi:H+/Cl- antiporter ClcA